MDGRRVDRAAAERFGRNLFMARRRAGFSQEELAALCALHRTEIGLLEKGRRLPRVDTLLKLSAAFAIEPELLLKGMDWVTAAGRGAGGFAVKP
ncbi:MAG TPA: helix-turn-helix transcriptional regulator [Solirubrobacterales bacterium]|jgi:transcriptional regulator with XRE-family HTH domain|nr:helix-turn-helix transcriptional regulator [Solirubrobacterales bacterium]